MGMKLVSKFKHWWPSSSCFKWLTRPDLAGIVVLSFLKWLMRGLHAAAVPPPIVVQASCLHSTLLHIQVHMLLGVINIASGRLDVSLDLFRKLRGKRHRSVWLSEDQAEHGGGGTFDGVLGLGVTRISATVVLGCRRQVYLQVVGMGLQFSDFHMGATQVGVIQVDPVVNVIQARLALAPFSAVLEGSMHIFSMTSLHTE
eukprot:1160980-Pelagomonas_calceolata.AAC.3